MTTSSLIIDTLFGSFINQLIFLLAVANSVFLHLAHKNISELKKALFEGESVLERFLQEHMGTAENADTHIRRDFSKWEQMYKASTRWYHLFITLITIFPLMGIGGTVMGIIPTLMDFSKVQSAFSLALVSTLLGIVFAVIFKFFEGFLSGSYSLVSERMAVITGDVTKYLIEKERK